MVDDILGLALGLMGDPCSWVLLDALGDLGTLGNVGTFSAGDPPELQRVYESATETLESDPDNVEAYFKRGVVCQSKGWPRRALADFFEVLHRQPDHARAWLLLSEVFSKVGAHDQAGAAHKRALDLDPSLQ